MCDEPKTAKFISHRDSVKLRMLRDRLIDVKAMPVVNAKMVQSLEKKINDILN